MWIVTIKLEPTEERLAARPAHREKLTSLHDKGVVRMAGPLADDTAAIIIVDAADRATVDDIIAADPYYRTPGVTVSDVQEWKPFLN